MVIFRTKYHEPICFETYVLPSIRRIKPISRPYSLKSVIKLSQPKESKQIWLTSFGPKIVWGSQDMMAPISNAALHTKPTERLMQLAIAKRNFQLGTNQVNRPAFLYSSGRPSTIWTIREEALKAVPSERIKELATPKQSIVKDSEQQREQHNCGRISPIWNVSKAAKECPERPRTTQLAKPRDPHVDYQWNREFATVSNPAALHAFPSERIEELAQPVFKVDLSQIDSRKSEDHIWKVSKAARTATASARIQAISKPTPYPEGFVPNRELGYFISPAALTAVTKQRYIELSKPVIRESMDHVQFNPDAFSVRPSALHAVCSARISELAVPSKR